MITEILCPVCHEPCGREYSATRIDPSFCEGKGEDYTDSDGTWHCSDKCLAVTLKEKAEEMERE